MSFIIQNISLSLRGGTLDVSVLNDETTAESIGTETSHGISIEQLQAGLEENPGISNIPELLTKILKKSRNLDE